MELRPHQVCRTTEGWHPVRIPSQTQEDLTYIVYVSPWGKPTENICECRGYAYRGQCAHQYLASEAICGWSEINPRGPRQTPEQRQEKVCPRCMGPTKWEIEVE